MLLQISPLLQRPGFDSTAARSRGTFDLTAATRVPGSDFAGMLSGNATVAVSPAQYYVLVLANTGASAPTDVLYQFATYSAASRGSPPAHALQSPALSAHTRVGCMRRLRMKSIYCQRALLAGVHLLQLLGTTSASGIGRGWAQKPAGTGMGMRPSCQLTDKVFCCMRSLCVGGQPHQHKREGPCQRHAGPRCRARICASVSAAHHAGIHSHAAQVLHDMR